MSAILLIEDDAIVQHVHMLMLKKLGHSVDLAETAVIALDKLKNNSYEIIFVDIGLPDMDGIDLIREIRTLLGEKENFPILALTGYIGRQEKTACFAAGATDVVHKPILMTKMLEVLKKYLA